MDNIFQSRHIGPRTSDMQKMLDRVGADSVDDLIDQTIPRGIRLNKKPEIAGGMNEHEYFRYLREVSFRNRNFRCHIGQGYYPCIMPAVIQRNVLENPSWYTSYTPYQAEISQGRLEALLNFQTMVLELTGMEVANASLLDEPTAAAEAMSMLFGARSREKASSGAVRFFVDEAVFPQTLAVLQTRSVPLGIELVTGDFREFRPDDGFFGIFLQYPASDGSVRDYREVTAQAARQGIAVAVAADLLSLTLLVPPGEWGADVVVGSTQRFGIPMGYGGPHAAYFATREGMKRHVPGRIIGISVDRHGKPALRMALQTREQHIRREKATSNICTAQALLATMAGMYGIWHGPDGLIDIASAIHFFTVLLDGALEGLGYVQRNEAYFDTLRITVPEDVTTEDLRSAAESEEVNFWYLDGQDFLVSLDEMTTLDDVDRIIRVLAVASGAKYHAPGDPVPAFRFPASLRREGPFMEQEVFHRYRSETEMMRYIKKLERKDFSLTEGMISLGSCTMKLNAAIEMLPLSWPEFTGIHPFVPLDQAEGYQQLFNELGHDLKELTGLPGISFMPNSGASGELTGLLVIRAWHKQRGEAGRDVCLIPASAHGTNPASAAMAGMEVVVVGCDDQGNIRTDELRVLAKQYSKRLAAFMVTYPSTHGVFEEGILDMAKIVHEFGGQVYMDGANMNAQVGFTSPAMIGADVCHLNLHKTFAIPHGGGGPGMGPILVAEHLIEHLPTHPVVPTGGTTGISAVAGAPWGSASILTISHAYIRLLGGEGLRQATGFAILNANYLASSLDDYFPVLYKGRNGTVGHEMVLDCRSFRTRTGITETDIAKRLMDYGFHAPTLSFPVHGTLMVEPTESESLQELDRFVEAMVSIYHEIGEIENGAADKTDNVLKNAPHTAGEAAGDHWEHPYSRKKAAFPLPRVEAGKFWPSVARLDEAYGDRNLVCSCDTLEEMRIKQEQYTAR